MQFLQMFSDEQALTLDELVLTKKLYSFLNMRELHKDHSIFYINFDASGWNNKFRDGTVRPVVENTIDKVMGTKIWKWTHNAYENTMIIIPDDLHMIWWKGQLGGIEGLNQPTWQLVYSGQIKTAFEGTNFKYYLLAKGDDMRAVITVPNNVLPTLYKGKVAKDLKEKVCKAATQFGHEIKIQESYVSENLFTFSKAMYFDQVPLTYVYRKIQKTHGDTNRLLPFLDDYVASAYSNAHGACASSTTQLAQYLVGIFWSISFTLRHPVYKNGSDLLHCALQCVPSTVGGLPIIHLHNFFVRAESDLLTGFIGLYKHAEKIDHPIAPVLRRFLEIPRDTSVTKAMLLNDPYSLPLYRPKSLAVKLKRIMARKLIHASIKKDIKELLRL